MAAVVASYPAAEGLCLREAVGWWCPAGVWWSYQEAETRWTPAMTRCYTPPLSATRTAGCRAASPTCAHAKRPAPALDSRQHHISKKELSAILVDCGTLPQYPDMQVLSLRDGLSSLKVGTANERREETGECWTRGRSEANGYRAIPYCLHSSRSAAA